MCVSVKSIKTFTSLYWICCNIVSVLCFSFLAVRISAPQPGIKSTPPVLEGKVPTTRLPGKSNYWLVGSKARVWSPFLHCGRPPPPPSTGASRTLFWEEGGRLCTQKASEKILWSILFFCRMWRCDSYLLLLLSFQFSPSLSFIYFFVTFWLADSIFLHQAGFIQSLTGLERVSLAEQ